MDSLIACRQPRPRARLRLYCLPYAGGSAAIFRAWPDGLPQDIEVCPIQLPGHGTRLRERPFTRLLPLVQELARALLPHLDKPFALFGHSLGALISFELIRELRRTQSPLPVRLFASGASAAQLPRREASLHNSPEMKFIAELRRLNGTPTKVLEHEELMRIMLPILRADFALYETYVYVDDIPLSCPISTFGGLDDRRVSRSDLEGWRDQTNSTFSLKMFPGDHFFLNSAPSQLLQTLSEELR